MSFGSSKKKKSQRKGLSLTTSARFLTFLQRNGRFTNLFFITLQLQVLLPVAIYNSHVQWKIKSITYAVRALLRNSEARLLIGFVWNQYRQLYYTLREQFYLCLKRNADGLLKGMIQMAWSQLWPCKVVLLGQKNITFWLDIFWYLYLLRRAGQDVVDGIGYRHTRIPYWLICWTTDQWRNIS